MAKKKAMHGKFKVSNGSVPLDAGTLMFTSLSVMRLQTLYSMKDDLLMSDVDMYKNTLLTWINQAIENKT